MLHAGEFVSLLLGEWVGAGGWDDGVKGEFACKKNDTRVHATNIDYQPTPPRVSAIVSCAMASSLP